MTWGIISLGGKWDHINISKPNITVIFCLQLIQKLSVPWRIERNVFLPTGHYTSITQGQKIVVSQAFIILLWYFVRKNIPFINMGHFCVENIILDKSHFVSCIHAHQWIEVDVLLFPILLGFSVIFVSILNVRLWSHSRLLEWS